MSIPVQTVKNRHRVRRAGAQLGERKAEKRETNVDVKKLERKGKCKRYMGIL